MFINKSLFTLLLSILISYNSYAEKLPHGCEVIGFGFNGTNLVINERGIQAFYLMQNRSLQSIELQRVENSDVFMSPPLIAKIAPAKWGAFASDITNLHFQCFSIEKGNHQKIDCRDVLEVCQYPRAKFALSNMGNYWVSSNKSQQDIINDATSKGIYLRW
jgi:hypothetical protein